jgi:hypothetical protein
MQRTFRMCSLDSGVVANGLSAVAMVILISAKGSCIAAEYALSSQLRECQCVSAFAPLICWKR